MKQMVNHRTFFLLCDEWLVWIYSYGFLNSNQLWKQGKTAVLRWIFNISLVMVFINTRIQEINLKLGSEYKNVAHA